MQPRHFQAGTPIFAAGDPSEAVYIIESGQISISVNDTEIARLGAGELFGESGVLEKRPRSAGAVAVTDTTLLATPADTFLSAFGMNNERALALVRMLCRRLRDTNLKGVREAGRGVKPAPPDAPISLVPDHPLLSGFYGVRPLAITHLPFEVGNRQGGEALAIASNHSLTIQAHGRIDLAAPHFEILRRDSRIGIHDLKTPRGTIVNGVTLGRGTLEAFSPLHEGDNLVIAGAPDSVFRFRVHVMPGQSTPRAG